ncbi:MAG: zinc-binding dehydrogenase, partial [Lactobacillaceae bacterium]|nr:zinc-binding dehydrogenase [Lactobacillaceae bacterium]
RVFWAGDYTKDGSYSEYQYVDERIVGIAPKISDELAVSLPLTSLTAYEALFEKIGESNLKSSPSLLIINGAGGVGSIAIQMAKNAGMKVIATASRPETIDWVKELGADIIIDHHQSLVDQLSGFDIHSVDNVLYLASMAPTWQEVAELIAPNGNIVSVTGGQVDINYGQLKQKAVNYKWEWMFSKAKFKYNEISQHEILNLVSKQVEVGQIVPTTKKVLNGLTVENINASHNLIKSGQSIGKIVIMF